MKARICGTWLRLLAVASLSAALLLLGGCTDEKGGRGAEPGNSSPATAVSEKHASSGDVAQKPEKEKQEQKLTVNVYYPDDQGTKLIAVKRYIKATAQKDKYTAAMESLMQGTKAKGQTTIIPKQAKLRSVRVESGVAKVDFSQDIVKHFVGGSTGEEMLVGSVVDTLTEFPEVKKVQILIEGKSVETLAGHMDLSEPLKRMDNLLK